MPNVFKTKQNALISSCQAGVKKFEITLSKKKKKTQEIDKPSNTAQAGNKKRCLILNERRKMHGLPGSNCQTNASGI